MLAAVVFGAAQAPTTKPVAVSPKPFEKQWDKPLGLPGKLGIAVGTRRVIVSDDQAGIEAHTVEDGSLAWARKDLPTPVPVVLSGGLAFVASKGQLHALDEVTGDTRWSHDVADRVAGLLPSETGAVIAAGSTIQAWSANGAQVWKQTPAADVIPSSFASDANVLYAGLADKTLTALDAKTGSVLWTKRLATTPRALTAAMGRVYFGGDDKRLYGYDAKGKKKLDFRRMDVTGPPARDDKHVYVATLFPFTTLFRSRKSVV